MSKKEKIPVIISVGLFVLGIISIVASRILKGSNFYDMSDTDKYINNLKLWYLSNRFGAIGCALCVPMVVLVVSAFMMNVRHSYYTLTQKITIVVILVSVVCFVGYLLPNTLAVAFGKPEVSTERIIGKGETIDMSFRYRPAFHVSGGYVPVDDTMDRLYKEGDSVIIYSCGGVPLEAHQPEVHYVDGDYQEWSVDK